MFWSVGGRLSTAGWAIAAVQALHGITFGAWYLSLVRHVQVRSPSHLRTSLQSLAGSFVGLGMVAGYLGGGQIFAAWGGAAVYRLAALASASAFALYACSALVERRVGGRPLPGAE